MKKFLKGTNFKTSLFDAGPKLSRGLRVVSAKPNQT
jgi:hypothetical protein